MSGGERALSADPAAEPGQCGVSVIVPVVERPAALDALYREYSAPLSGAGVAFEFLFIAQPAFTARLRPLLRLVGSGEPIQLLEAGQAMSEAALLQLAASRSRWPVILSLPAYRRVEAACLPALVQRVEAGADMAVARRWPRRDSWVNQLQNRVFHGLLGTVEGSRLHDLACGVRAIRRDLLDEIPLYGDFLRFLPVFAAREGYRVEELSCTQHPDDVGARVYPPGIYLRRVLDLLGIVFLVRFRDKPLRFFGLVGSTLLAGGGGLLALLLIQRLGGNALADRPLLLLAVLLLVLGFQAVALGLVGEIIVHLNAPNRKSYRVVRSSSDPPPAAEADTTIEHFRAGR